MQLGKFTQCSEQGLRNKITITTFLNSLFVIYVHANNWDLYELTDSLTGIGWAAWALEIYTRRLVCTAVPMFFMISGYLFFRNFELSGLWRKWRSRLFSVALPYLVWAALHYIYFAVLTNTPLIRRFILTDFRVELTISEFLNWLWNKPYDNLWFLKALIQFLAAAPLIWLVLKEHFPRFPFVGLTILTVLLILQPQWLNFYNGTPFFLLGCYIGLNCPELVRWRCRGMSLAAAGVIAVLLAVQFFDFSFWPLLLFYAAFWLVLDLIPGLERLSLPWWMSVTFFTYVSHGVLLNVLQRLVYLGGGAKPVWAIISYLLVPLVTELILIGIAWVLIRFTPRFWMLLSGCRVPELGNSVKRDRPGHPEN